jgi:tricarballylate dehydrogenase
LHLSRTNAFFMGGGKALVNAYYRSAEAIGIEIRYNAAVTDIEVQDGVFKAVKVGNERIEAAACVAAS